MAHPNEKIKWGDREVIGSVVSLSGSDGIRDTNVVCTPCSKHYVLLITSSGKTGLLSTCLLCER